MKDDEFESSVWKLWTNVHDEIGPLREESYKILAHIAYEEQSLQTRISRRLGIEQQEKNKKPGEEIPELRGCYKCKSTPQPKDDDPAQLKAFAEQAFDCARNFQTETEKIRKATPEEVLRITTRAGVLLYYTEQILLRYDGLRSQTRNKNQLPENFGKIVLSLCMTVAATARDHIVAGSGHVSNLKEYIGSKERSRLFWLLAFTAIPYLLFHPRLHPLSIIYPSLSFPLQYRIYWDVLFWSLFGALSISVITVSEDVMRESFDPRHVFKYEYKIAVAPFVALVLIFFLSMVGITSGNTTITLNVAKPNFPVIALLSFLFGFFGKRALELLDIVWQRLFPSTRSKGTPKSENAKPSPGQPRSTNEKTRKLGP